MEYLDKESILFERDEEGELIPISVALKGIKKDNKEVFVLVKPLTRGEIKRMSQGLDKDGETTKDQDAELLLTHIINPKITQNEIDEDTIRPEYFNAMVVAVLTASRLDVDKTFSEAVEFNEDEFKRKLESDIIMKKKNDLKLEHFLHKIGYNFFNMNKLTVAEIDQLVTAHNMEIKEQKRINKRAKARRKK